MLFGSKFGIAGDYKDRDTFKRILIEGCSLQELREIFHEALCPAATPVSPEPAPAPEPPPPPPPPQPSIPQPPSPVSCEDLVDFNRIPRICGIPHLAPYAEKCGNRHSGMESGRIITGFVFKRTYEKTTRVRVRCGIPDPPHDKDRERRLLIEKFLDKPAHFAINSLEIWYVCDDRPGAPNTKSCVGRPPFHHRVYTGRIADFLPRCTPEELSVLFDPALCP